MDSKFYLKEFESALAKIKRKEFDENNIKLFVGIVLNSVAFKVYKAEWSGDSLNPLTASARIFFSVWLNDESVKENKLYYNIHAFKLRQFKGYKIGSRDFAKRFRNKFKQHEKKWENMSMQFGPLTLMQGWLNLKNRNLQNDIIELAQNFIDVSPLIDTTLEYYKM